MSVRVLFVVPPSRAQNTKIKPYTFPHMGIGYLISYLKNKGITTSVVDTSLDYKNKDQILLSAIKSFKPDLIGLSLYSNIVKEGIEIVDLIRNNCSVPIVVGGPHISCTKEDFIKKSQVEYGISKEGERPLYNLIKCLFINKPKDRGSLIKELSGISGLIFRNEIGDFVINENDDLIEDLDSVPYPDYFSFDFSNYPDFRSKQFTMITSRGCPYLCNYCAAPLCTSRNFRTRSALNVVNEIEYWKGYGFNNFGIFDDSFNQNMDRAKDVCRELFKRNLGIKFDLYNGIRANRVDEELFVLLKKSGCTFIGFGMESGNEDMLKRIGKNLKRTDLINAIELANKVGIPTAVNFILGHPGETFKTAMDTLNFAKEIKSSYVNIYSLIPIPGTRAYDELKKEARFFYSEDYYLSNFVAWSTDPIFETDQFTGKERKKLYRMGRNLTKKTIFLFRFGKFWGTIIYSMLYSEHIFNFVHYFRETGWLGRLYNRIRRT